MIPVVDLFAGPGGLGEGFGSFRDSTDEPVFDIRSSFEKEPVAHRTLSLRAFYRAFGHPSDVPGEYYQYLRDRISREDLLGNPRFHAQTSRALEEAHCRELGLTPAEEVDRTIARALRGNMPWVLIGGPPCQVYSVVGRSRWRRDNVEKFEGDHRHFLYKEYLRIIQKFQPAVFVMENVRGVLSSTHGGSPIFERILDDLSSPSPGLHYEIRSFNCSGDARTTNPMNFVVQSENHGLPQARHRVMLLGVREDIRARQHQLLTRTGSVSVNQAIHDLPRVRSRLSRGKDSPESWQTIFDELLVVLARTAPDALSFVKQELELSRAGRVIPTSAGGRYMRDWEGRADRLPANLAEWLRDERLEGGYIQHEARAHMRSDLHRYLYYACYAKRNGCSPKVDELPPELLPQHVNVHSEKVPFRDRFRVQIETLPSTTVVSHISKDGHYYIHYDPAQCRSLTVREAARLQTFPDNYFFEGNRTEQYWQVGNAVPPFLARQVAGIVAELLQGGEEAAESTDEASRTVDAKPVAELPAW
ncbi:DNA cytosine methyltransferase [Accumulibacter sp.]|uniref:DNA cytosine methyltransferase n=1 Tax=Accumulibacter sp. TaxID=2053492 RepID=UPI0028C45CDD|nr:DNA cytosine methyltransferase [Accumulibacter sp.]